MSDRVRYGIVGASGIAQRRMIPAFVKTQHSTLAAICSRSLSAAKTLAEPHGAIACDHLEDLFDHVDAIYVATPVHCHRQEAQRILEAGKHLLLEKPLARTSQEGRDIIAFANAAGVHTMEAYMMKFHPAHKAIHEAVQAGRIGRVLYARARLGCWYPDLPGAWRQDPALSGGGAFMDLGSHLLDLLTWLVGPVTSVRALTTTQLFSYPVEDSATALLQFSSGAHGVVESYFSFPDDAGAGTLELVGTEGRILATDTIGQNGSGSIVWEFFPAQVGYQAQQTAIRNSVKHREDFPPVDLYAAQLDYFSTSILRKIPPDMNRLEDGLAILQWIERAYTQHDEPPLSS